MSPGRGKLGIEIERRDRARLLQGTLREHGVEPDIDPMAHLGTGAPDDVALRVGFADQGHARPPLPFGERNTRAVDHLQRTHYALRIPRIEAACHFRITFGEHGVEL